MTSTDNGYRRFERWQPRNWSLAVKLAAVLLVPVLLGMALGVARIVEHTKQATALGSLDRFVQLDGKAAELIDQLQRERDQAVVFVANNRSGDKAALQTQFGTTDGKISELSALLEQPSTLGGAAQTAYQRAKDNLDRLADLRNQVNGAASDTGANADTAPDRANPPNAPNPANRENGENPANRQNGENRANPPAASQTPGLIAGYTGVVEPMLVFQTALDRQLDTPALVGPAAALSALALAKEQVALQHAVIAVAVARGQMLPADADTVRASDAELSAAIDQFRAALDADQQARFAGFLNDPVGDQRQQLKQTALSRVGGPRAQLGISPADWDNASNAVADEMRGGADGLRGEALRISAAQQDAARNASGIDSVILLLALVAAAAVVFLVGRSMLRPLRTLRSTALDIAERRLPGAVQRLRAGEPINPSVEPVPVHSSDEFGQLARAFDEVHGQAVRLAAEQANLQTNVSSMFVNLSRRSQGLVERQLQLIEQLERNEQDAEQLSNLFQLDHLATRMRRNSENLLVLAGADLAKRGSQPVPVVDVLRAAVSEIEQYQRVVVQQPPAVRLVGRAASDMVHLVAELLDNATVFSAPDTQVVVSSTVAPNGTLRVDIADQGVGMPGEELIAANNRLAGPSEVDVSASRRMGLFVVGRLAARHGVGVRLSSTDQSRGTGGGVTASVTVPTELVVADADLPVGDRSGADRRAAARARDEHPTEQHAFADQHAFAHQHAFADQHALVAPVDADDPDRTAVFPVAAAEPVPRAGLAAESMVGAVNGVAVNGAPVNGAPVNGTAVNGTAVGETNGVAREVGPSGLPRRSPRSDTAASADAAASAGPDSLPRRSAGATLGRPPRQTQAGQQARPDQERRPGQQAPPEQQVQPSARRERAEQAQPFWQPDRGGHHAQHDEADDAAGSTAPLDPAVHADLARPPARPAAPAHRLGEPPRRERGWPRSDQPTGATGGSPPGGPTRRYPKQPYLRGRAGQVPTPPSSWFNQRHGRGPTEQPGQGPVQHPGQGPVEQPGQGPVQHPGQGPVEQPGQGPTEQPGQGPGEQPAQGQVERPGSTAPEQVGASVPRRPGAPVPDRGLPAPESEAPVPERGPESDHDAAAVEPLAGNAEPAGTEAQPAAGHAAKTTANGHLAHPPTRHGLAGQSEDASIDPAAQQVAPTDIEPRRIPEAERMVPSSQAEPEPLSQQPRSEQAGRAGRSESPIFEEMAPAWFREDLEFDQDRDVAAPGAGAPGWSAGEPLLRPMPEPGGTAELTTAGLPKRRPRSQLIPGSASGAGSAPAGVPVRSPEQVRGRLASYQQGVRQGRASRHRRSDTAGEHSAPESHWEEKP